MSAGNSVKWAAPSEGTFKTQGIKKKKKRQANGVRSKGGGKKENAESYR